MKTNLQMTLLILQEMERLREEMEGFRQQLRLRPEPPWRPDEMEQTWLADPRSEDPDPRG